MQNTNTSTNLDVTKTDASNSEQSVVQNTNTEIDQYFAGTQFAGSRVRYVHNINGDYYGNSTTGGWTAAYIRNADKIIFAIAFCHSNDKYVKAEGRKHSAARLKEYYNGTADLTKNICGVIGVGDLIDCVASLTNILSDRITENLTVLDFKHAAIGSLIMTHVNLRKYHIVGSVPFNHYN